MIVPIRFFRQLKVFFLILLLVSWFHGCGNDFETNLMAENDSYEGNTGSYQCRLVFPAEPTPSVPNAKALSTVNCASAGIASVRFTFYSAVGDFLTEKSWPCTDHKGTVSNIPPGENITVFVTAEDDLGNALFWGDEQDISISIGQETSGGEITMGKVINSNSPVIRAGIDPKTLLFNWRHISFPDNSAYYRLELKHSDELLFSGVVGSEKITTTEYRLTVPVHLTDWDSIAYRVVALNSDNHELAASQAIDLKAYVAAEDTIGFLRSEIRDVGDSFGKSIALSLDGNTLAVGAPGEDSDSKGINGPKGHNSNPDSGAVYVYTRSNTGNWKESAYIKASNSDAGDYFGSSIALSKDGNRLVIGAYGEGSAATGINGDQGNNAAPWAGAVYVFTRLETDTWKQEAYIKAEDNGEDNLFGHALAVSSDGSTLAVGTGGEDWGGTDTVYMFHRRDNGGWDQTAVLRAEETDSRNGLNYGNRFGLSLAISANGNTLAVGASGEDNGASGIDPAPSDTTLNNSGAAYVFHRTDIGIWTQEAYIKAGNSAADDWFGNSVALSSTGSTLAVGAERRGAGAAYIFSRRSNGAWGEDSYLIPSSTDRMQDFGRSVALSTDGSVLAVGADGEDSSATGINGEQLNEDAENSGAVYLFIRDGSGEWVQTTYIKSSNTEAEDGFGEAVAIGADDRILSVGADGKDDQTGAVYLY